MYFKLLEKRDGIQFADQIQNGVKIIESEPQGQMECCG